MAQVAPTALPRTGFAEEVGIPGLIGLAIASILVIFVVRRVRSSTS
jgi:LPXTG-motif cell wall-anchored protein